MKKLFTLFAVALIGFSIACKSTLETGGAYAPGTNVVVNGSTNVVATAAPDRAFFIVDSSFELAYGAVEAVFQFERNNRKYLWSISPSIKHTLDSVRPQAAEAARAYFKARDSYKANPTPAGLTQLQTILSQVQKAAASAEAALPK